MGHPTNRPLSEKKSTKWRQKVS